VDCPRKLPLGRLANVRTIDIHCGYRLKLTGTGTGTSITAHGSSERDSVTRFFASGFFFMKSFPQAPDYTIRAVLNLLKILGDIRSSRFATGVVDTGGKWKKSSIRNFYYFFWTPLGSKFSI
jgi:hypothetical protein